MSKLPFVVQPRLKPRKDIIGNDEVGKIEIERKGYLTVAEKAFINSQLTGDTTASLFIKLTRKVSTELKMDMNDAYTLISEVMQGDIESDQHRQIAEDFKEDIMDLVKEMTSLERIRVLTCVYCLLLYRVNPDLDPEAIDEMHPDLVDMIMEFYQEEESKTIKRLEELQDEKSDDTEHVVEALEKK